MRLPLTAVVNLGCPKNQVDAEQLVALLERAGFPLTPDTAAAEAIIVNTCAFIQPAVEESIETILALAALKESGPCRRLVVCGCLPQRYGADLRREIPEIDLALGCARFVDLPDRLRRLEAGVPLPGGATEITTPDFRPTWQLPQSPTSPFAAYLKISEGCDNHCRYCLIPQLKGKQASVPPEFLEMRARQLVYDGVRELTLVAQDITTYGRDLHARPTIGSLIERLLTLDDLAWIRLLYAHPKRVDDELLHLIGGNDRVCPYLDVPVQHASPKILRAMHRPADSDKMTARLEHIRAAWPEIHLRSTVIVGFPGETDADFACLQKFVERGFFTWLGCFRFWPEEGTAAASLPERVLDEVITARHQAIVEVQSKITAARLGSLVGTVVPLLVEGPSTESDLLIQGRTNFQAPEIDGVTYITDGITATVGRPGSIVPARITGVNDVDLTAVLDSAS
jgi:ribosomal protein S12 methylthiotransferase